MFDPYAPAAVARADERHANDEQWRTIGTCKLCHGPIIVSPDGEVEYCDCIDRED